jgi:hypothetical protein
MHTRRRHRLLSYSAVSVALAAPLLVALAARAQQVTKPADPSTSPSQSAEDYTARCVLPAGVSVMRVPPPYSAGRLAFYRAANPSQAKAIPRGPDAMMLQWRGQQLRPWGMTFGQPYTTASLISVILAVHSAKQIEGDPALLSAKVEGDIVVDFAAVLESRRIGMEKMLSDVAGNAVTIEFREVERPVTVLSGQWKYKPVADNTPQRPRIEIYGPELNAKDRRNYGGGGSGNADSFAGALGNWLSQEIVIDSATVPKQLSWHYNENLGDPLQRGRGHDPELVLKHIEEQTGLTAKTETRRVMHVFVQAGL